MLLQLLADFASKNKTTSIRHWGTSAMTLNYYGIGEDIDEHDDKQFTLAVCGVRAPGAATCPTTRSQTITATGEGRGDGMLSSLSRFVLSPLCGSFWVLIT